MSQPAVIGYYTTKFGELWNQSLSDLIKESVEGALQSSNLNIEQVDAIFFANMLGGILDNDLHLSAKIAESLGVNIPIFRVESACASGGMAFHLGLNYLKSGTAKTVLVLGGEKMTDYDVEDVTTALASAASEEEQIAGLTFPGLYGLLAQSYLQKFGYSEEHLAHISVKNHYHGSFNPKGQFTNQITLEQALQSQYVARPLKVLDCSPISDGAAAIVLTVDSDLIASSTQKIQVLASEVATDVISLKNRDSLVEIKSTKIAAQKAFDSVKIDRSDINVIELHDCFSIAEILALEDMGFWEKGKGGEMAARQKTRFDDNDGLVVNTSGGLKASGHPVGATGVKQIGEIFLQLNNLADQRQVKNAKFGLTHNVGGSGGSAVVNIFSIYETESN
jgi:acetyl-CoA C-acetyltransferase